MSTLDLSNTPLHRLGLMIPAALGLLLLFAMLAGSFVAIDQGERGVQLRFGRVVAVLEPGIHFKLPFADEVRLVSVQNQSYLYEKIQAYSRDQQPASMRVSVNFHIPEGSVEELYSQYGTIDRMGERLIHRIMPNIIENTFGQYTAIRAVQERAGLTADVSASLRDSVDGPVVIDSVQIENIDFSDAYERSIEDRMKAEVEIQTKKQNLESERINAEIAVTQARARADSALAEAQAQAEAIRVRGEAEAAAIRARGEALRQNSGLVELTAVEKWNGALPQTMVPGSALPFLGVK